MAIGEFTGNGASADTPKDGAAESATESTAERSMSSQAKDLSTGKVSTRKTKVTAEEKDIPIEVVLAMLDYVKSQLGHIGAVDVGKRPTDARYGILLPVSIGFCSQCGKFREKGILAFDGKSCQYCTA